MANLKLSVLDKNNELIVTEQGEDFVCLVCRREYQEGDHIVLETSEKDIYIMLQLDDALGAAYNYVIGTVDYQIPFGEKRISYSPKVFTGDCHYLYAKVADREEIHGYRNLALNPNDQHENTNSFPHAWANVETRGESVFAARNAIDGVCANKGHGQWPYESWGINMQDDAEITVEFGRTVSIDKVELFTRADFPHDNWWKLVTLYFSDGSTIEWSLEKSSEPHTLSFPERKVSWVKLANLIKSDDPSPFPALSQIMIYGKEK